MNQKAAGKPAAFFMQMYTPFLVIVRHRTGGDRHCYSGILPLYTDDGRMIRLF